MSARAFGWEESVGMSGSQEAERTGAGCGEEVEEEEQEEVPPTPLNTLSRYLTIATPRLLPRLLPHLLTSPRSLTLLARSPPHLPPPSTPHSLPPRSSRRAMASTNGIPDSREGDERIKEVLRQAMELADELEPLFTWEELCEIVAECRLELLERHPRLEDLYTTLFNPLIKSLYGSTESYLRQQLGWGGEPERKEEEEREYWTRGGVTNVRRNDWPYAVPKDVRHYVVWVPLPLFHPALCTPRPSNLLDLPPSASQSGTSTPSGSSRTNPLAKPFAPPLPHEPSICSALSPSLSRVGRASVAPTKGSWDFVCRNGLGGLTGRAEEWWRVRRRENQREKEDKGGEENDQDGARRSGEYDENVGPEKEIRAFVLKKWRVEDGWETAWFANPPALQSVPGLAHFHVLARRHPVENGTSE